jgi:hypothetical protein
MDLVESFPATGASGGVRSATCYNFQVDGKQVTVEVHNRATHTRDGIMPAEKVQRAAKSFLETEIERWGMASLPNSVVLDSPTMDSVLNRLGCGQRFPRLASLR